MTETPPVTRPFASWLEALIVADPDDRRMISIDGIDAGYTHRRVWCERHKVMLNWLSAFSHLDRTEASHRLHEGSHARLHQPGDLVPAFHERSIARCDRCRDPIIWAATSTGGRVALNAEPSTAGTVVLTEAPGATGTKPHPLAMFLHTEQQRSYAPAGSIYVLHRSTCSGAPRRRRRSSS